MTIADAIKIALTNLGKPSTYEEIYQEILDKRLYEFGAKDPKSIVRVKLRIHTLGLNFPSASQNKLFKIQSGEGKNSLYINLDDVVVETVAVSPVKTNVPTKLDKVILFLKSKWNRILANKDAHKITLHECCWMLFGSFLPIIVDSVFRVWCLKVTFISALSENIKGGEVFLFTSALITPFFYFLVKNLSTNNKENDELPYIGYIFALTIVSLLAGLGAFIYYRTGAILAAKNSSLMLDIFSARLGGWAWAIYISSLSVWYYSAYMSNKSSKAYSKIRTSQADKLSEEYSEVRG
ncbi:hypothetical protein [Photorhabdus tasmaniensis]|uniref:Uncharacterized protein n=1 Tax=Photorhabdus tasmaniensis TaxID=1004159 RepID=A0ABX0GI95_9GAMM|nr:hypothetical protein [Photorhabdus tasmaniensis]NHB88057.1 hypothetical protein [Photorhabdus tasmaniensis]